MPFVYQEKPVDYPIRLIRPEVIARFPEGEHMHYVVKIHRARQTSVSATFIRRTEDRGNLVMNAPLERGNLHGSNISESESAQELLWNIAEAAVAVSDNEEGRKSFP